MALLTPTVVGPNATLASIAAAGVAAAGGGDTFAHSGKEVLFITNGGGGSITVTLTSRADNFGQVLTAHDITRTVAAGATAVIGATEASKFRDSATGLVNVTYTGVTSVTVALLSFATTA